MMDVPIDEQELPEPVRLRAIYVVPDEWEKLGRIRHQRTTSGGRLKQQAAENPKARIESILI